jgi:hypothetical protein
MACVSVSSRLVFAGGANRVDHPPAEIKNGWAPGQFDEVAKQQGAFKPRGRERARQGEVSQAQQVENVGLGHLFKTARRALEAVFGVEAVTRARTSGASAASNSALRATMASRKARKFIGLHRIETGGEKTVVRRDVEIEQPLILLGARAGDHRAQMGVVGMLFLGETDIAVDPEGRGLAAQVSGISASARRMARSSISRPRGSLRCSSNIALFSWNHFAVLVKAEGFEEGQRLVAKALDNFSPKRTTTISALSSSVRVRIALIWAPL